METTAKKQIVNSLKHKVFKNHNGLDYYVTISLDDDCKNGHSDFSITASIYEEGRKAERYLVACGCCHDDILKVFPELKLYVDLHLSDVNGTPMYAVENGFYFMEKGEHDTLKSVLRITDKELDFLVANSEDKIVFAYNIVSMGLPKRWKKEADKAIKWLEEMTGCIFKDNSTKLHKVEIPKRDIKLVEDRKAKGYYTKENIDKRKAKALENQKNEVLIQLKRELDEEIKKHTDEYNVKVAILNTGLVIDNFIYYNHLNKGVFNWLDYTNKVTQQQFDKFLKKVDYNKMPEGISFSLGK